MAADGVIVSISGFSLVAGPPLLIAALLAFLAPRKPATLGLAQVALLYWVLGETQRRAEYERLYKEFVTARRAYEEARARKAQLHELQRLRGRFSALRERLGEWRRAG